MSPCLPAVYIFVLRCLYPGTDKHNLIGYPQSLLLEKIAAMGQWGGGLWATSIKHVRAAVEALPLFTHHLLHYKCSLYGGNSGRGLCIIGNLSSLKAITQHTIFQMYPRVGLSCSSWPLVFEDSCFAFLHNGEAVLGSFYPPQTPLPPSAV